MSKKVKKQESKKIDKNIVLGAEEVKKYLPSTSTRKPNAQDLFETVRDFYANFHFSRLFLVNLAREIRVKYSVFRAVSVLKSTKKFKIHNKETFFAIYLRDKHRDIGTSVFNSRENSVADYIARVMEMMSIKRGRGDSDIDLTSVLLHLAVIYKNEKNASKLDACMKIFVYGMITSKNSNPFIVNIIHLWLAEDMLEAMGLDRDGWYWPVVARFLTELNNTYKKDCAQSSPRVKLIVPVREDQKASKLKYLARVFNVSYANTKKVFSSINNMCEATPEMLTALAQMQSLSPLKVKEWDFPAMIRFLDTMERKNQLQTHTQPSTLFNYFEAGRNIPREVIRRFNITPEFYEVSTILEEPFLEEAHIEIDCSDLKTILDIKPYIHDAIVVMLLRVRDYRRVKALISCIYNSNTKMLVTLKNIKNYSTGFVAEVKDLQKELVSYYNRNIHLRINYDYDTATSKFGEAQPEYLRVISDIHADVNKDRNYIFDFGTDFVVNCGDTSGDCETTRSWIKSYMRDGVVVAGNHLGYTMPYPQFNGSHNIKNWDSEIDPRNTKNGQMNYLKECFKSGGVRFMSNNIWEVNDFIIMGNTLYTDFKLFGSNNQAACMVEASRSMNDFRYCYFLDILRESKTKIDGFVRRYTPEFHLKQFNSCIGYFRNRLEYLRRHNNKKPIIVVTHFAPVPFAITEEYKNDPLSAAFASDLRYFIDKYPEIRLWCFGHVHTPMDFIYNKTRFVCEPWGYFNENNFKIENYGKRIPLRYIKSKSGWRVLLKNEIKEGKVIDYGKPEVRKES